MIAHLTLTYKISASLICHGGNPSVLCTPPNTSARSGSGNPLVAADGTNISLEGINMEPTIIETRALQHIPHALWHNCVNIM